MSVGGNVSCRTRLAPTIMRPWAGYQGHADYPLGLSAHNQVPITVVPVMETREVMLFLYFLYLPTIVVLRFLAVTVTMLLVPTRRLTHCMPRTPHHRQRSAGSVLCPPFQPLQLHGLERCECIHKLGSRTCTRLNQKSYKILCLTKSQHVDYVSINIYNILRITCSYIREPCFCFLP